jgi:hypothetical protein
MKYFIFKRFGVYECRTWELRVNQVVSWRQILQEKFALIVRISDTEESLIRFFGSNCSCFICATDYCITPILDVGRSTMAVV